MRVWPLLKEFWPLSIDDPRRSSTGWLRVISPAGPPSSEAPSPPTPAGKGRILKSRPDSVQGAWKECFCGSAVRRDRDPVRETTLGDSSGIKQEGIDYTESLNSRP